MKSNEVKTESGSVRLICFLSSLHHVAVCPSAVARDSFQGSGGSGGGGLFTCVYILISINRSEFSLRSQRSQGKHSETNLCGGEEVVSVVDLSLVR